MDRTTGKKTTRTHSQSSKNLVASNRSQTLDQSNSLLNSSTIAPINPFKPLPEWQPWVTNPLALVTPLSVDFFENRPTDEIARCLVGLALVRQHRHGYSIWRLVEVEAYIGINDPACHSYQGRRTTRNQTMWGPAGRAYVYFIYGMYHCLNVVTQPEGVPEAILIRALEPVLPAPNGLWPWEYQWPGWDKRWVKQQRRWISGPGRLCRLLKIDTQANGWDLTDLHSPLWLGRWNQPWIRPPVEQAPRVGLGKAAISAHHWPLRFYLVGNPWVSDPKP